MGVDFDEVTQFGEGSVLAILGKVSAKFDCGLFAAILEVDDF